MFTKENKLNYPNINNIQVKIFNFIYLSKMQKCVIIVIVK